jgi:hypothetical protein
MKLDSSNYYRTKNWKMNGLVAEACKDRGDNIVERKNANNRLQNLAIHSERMTEAELKRE